MEDAHAAVLSLDKGEEKPNAFFAVYDGHGGMSYARGCPASATDSTDLTLGGSVAKFAGENVHKRLVTEEAYHEKRYEEALKRAFLGTDEDLLAGE